MINGKLVACEGKTPFHSRRMAQRVLARIANRKESGGPRKALQIYRCRYCGLLHIGNLMDQRSPK